MQRARLTTLSLLCAFLAPLAGAQNSPLVGSPFPARAIHGILGPKGAAVLCCGDAALPDQEPFQKLGLGLAAVQAKVQPGWYMLDPRGIVIAKYPADHDGRVLSPAAVLVHKFGWTPPAPATEVEGKQITAKVTASDASVAPGQRVALILDLDLNPGMHVYAPGVQGYIPIDWKMQDSPAAIAEPAVFPHAEKLFLKAIAERVPAYRNRFRLIRDITVGPAPDGSKEFTAAGSLRYQACDDRLCYIPQELHLAWTFQYREP
jgi:hypothetical protein